MNRAAAGVAVGTGGKSRPVHVHGPGTEAVPDRGALLTSPRADAPSDSARSPVRASAARRTIEALTADPDVFEDFFAQVGVGLALADLTGRYVRVNQAYAALVGRTPEDLVGVPLTEVLKAQDQLDEHGRSTLLLQDAQPSLQREERYVGPLGEELWVLHGVTVVRDAGGTPVWFAVSAQDITERRRAEESLRELTAVLTERAVRDPLTGLANRALLEERLRAALARDVRSGSRTAVLFLDLDGFKAVNDEHGHAVGDAVLRTVASRLTAGVRPSDTVARLGGDEFVVLVEGAGTEVLEGLVGRLEAAVAAPVEAAGRTVSVGVSTGVAVSERGERDAPGLLASADSAMYRAKRGRRP